MDSDSCLLCIDSGNTNVTLGLWQEDRWKAHWRARTVRDKMPDEYAVLVRSFLDEADLDYRAISGVAISSVVPSLTLAFTELVRRTMTLEPLVVDHRTPTGIRINIDEPQQAGPDRLVNAAAVHALYGGPAIVIDFGTATTFDVVSADGAYCGGAIAPGIGLAHDALVEHAARLHAVDLCPPPHAIGRNTIHAMQSGIFWGYVALVEGLVQRLSAEMSQEQVKIIATGGLATVFHEHTSVIDLIAPELTLDGLRIIYELNRPNRAEP
ncbi:MAG: type III pantothenate kinase [Anaerolineae bacterium]|nr:type III pantothenate kinase [Anaerolineae bacterium]